MNISRKKDFEVRPISEKSLWESALFSFRGKGEDTRGARVWPQSFLHSWNWGEFCESMGDQIFRLGVFAGETREKNASCTERAKASTFSDKPDALALLVKVRAKRGSFLLCPHGPLLSDWENADLRSALFSAIRSLGQREKVSFIRLCPLLPASRTNNSLFTSAGFREASIHMMHPELTWNLDLTPSEDALLAGMRKTTRYLVRRAEKMGVTVSHADSDDFLREFYRIHEDTVQRQHFVPFSFEYLQKELEAFRSKNAHPTAKPHEPKDSRIAIFLAHYQGQAISGAVIVFYGKMAFYHHGASLSAFRDVPASYLVQWRIITEAKRRGLSVYNFWGIAPDDRPNHPWAGLSLFKKGFGGYSESYVHAKDLVLKPNYWLTWVIEKARRVKRGL